MLQCRDFFWCIGYDFQPAISAAVFLE